MARMDGLVLDRMSAGRVAGVGVAERDELLRRAAWLEEKDRVIFQLSVKGNMTLREMSAIVAMPAGTISRRLSRIRERVRDRIVAALLDARGGLPDEFREVGLEFFLTGLKVAEIADRHRVPVERVRGIIQFVRGWHRGRAANS